MVQADKEFAECQDFHDAILDEFKKSVSQQMTFKKVNSTNRGLYGRVTFRGSRVWCDKAAKLTAL